MYPPILRVQKKKKKRKDQHNTNVMFVCLLIFFSPIFFINVYIEGTHNICLYKEVDKKYIGCKLKITEMLDCALIHRAGMCSN